MDSLPIEDLMQLFDLLPDGPAKEFIQTLAQSHYHFENRDMATSLRQAMVRAFSMAHYREAMLADWAVRAVGPDAQPLAPPPTPSPTQ